MTLYSLECADVSLRIYSLSLSLSRKDRKMGRNVNTLVSDPHVEVSRVLTEVS